MAAVATDAVNTAYHGIVRRAEVKKEETVFLFGLGGLGFNALQVVRYIGARVIVSDLRSEKLELAVQKGVPREDVVSVGKGIPEFVVDNGLQGKIDTVLDFVGSHQTFHDAQHIGESFFFLYIHIHLCILRVEVKWTGMSLTISTVRPGGKILCVGTHHRQNEVDMKIGIRKRLSIIFTYGGLPEDLAVVLDLIAKGKIQPRVETKTLPEMPTVLKDLCAGKIQDRVALVS